MDLPPARIRTDWLLDKEGKVWYTGNGNGTIGELDTATGKVIEHKAGGSPHTLVIDDSGAIWFTVESGYVGRSQIERQEIAGVPHVGGPYGLALDKRGNVWVCRMNADKMGSSIETGKISSCTWPGSQPRASPPPRRHALDPLLRMGSSRMSIPRRSRSSRSTRCRVERTAGRIGDRRRHGARVRERDPDRHRGDARSETEQFPSIQAALEERRNPKAIVDAQGRYWSWARTRAARRHR